MSDKKPTATPQIAKDGHQPVAKAPQPAAMSKTFSEGHQPLTKGHQPIGTPNKVTGGYQPTTSQGTAAPRNPPSQGSGGKK